MTGHDSISDLHFVDDTEDFVTSGHDGRLIRWTPDGGQTLVRAFDRPIDHFAMIRSNGTIIFSTPDGELWRADTAGQVRQLRSRGARIDHLLASADGHSVLAGYEAGELTLVDAKTTQPESLLSGIGAVRQIATATGLHDMVAVRTNDGTVRVGQLSPGEHGRNSVSWQTVTLRAHDIALTPDGLLMATSADGLLWLYSPLRRTLLCMSMGTTDLGKIAMAGDGRAAAVPDREGRLLWIDLEAARRHLDDVGSAAIAPP